MIVLDFAPLGKPPEGLNCGIIRDNERNDTMTKYVCKVCGYVYDPANNNNIAFEDLPDDWTCPLCGVGKDQFEAM